MKETHKAPVYLWLFYKFICMLQPYADWKKAVVLYYNLMAVRSVLPIAKVQSSNFTHFMDVKFDPLP